MNGRQRVALAVAVGLAGLLAAGITLSVRTVEKDSLFASAPGRASSLVDEADAQGLDALRLLSGPQGLRAEAGAPSSKTLYVVLTPQRPYDAEQARLLADFLEAGGQLLVADNFGHANSLTSQFGITFERVRLVPSAANGTLHAALAGTSFTLDAKAPTALHLAATVPTQVLAQSATDSFLDRDGDGLVQAEEPHGPFPVVVEAEIGSKGGRVVAVADPGLLWVEGGDPMGEAFRQALVAHLLPDGGRIVVDESRGARSDPLLLAAAALVGAATTDPWRFVIGGLSAILFALILLASVDGRWGPHRFDLRRFIRRAQVRAAAKAAASDPVDGPYPGTTPTRAVQWTRRGRAAGVGGLLLAIAGLAFGNLQATCAAAILLLASALALWTRKADVVAERTTSATRFDEGSLAEVGLALQASGRRAYRVEVLDTLPPEFELAEGSNWFQAMVGPRPWTTQRYAVRAALRGHYRVGPLHVRTRDVFGLRSIESEVAPAQDVLVLPRSTSLNRIPFKSRIPLLTMGPHLVSRAGDGTEFHALRNYQNGDSIRIVNWKASARSKEIVVNQRVHESKATLTVFLDARAISGAGPVRTNPLNEGCRATMSIVTGGLRARDNVRVFTYGSGVQELAARATQGKAHVIAEALAGIEAAGDMTFLQAVQESLPTLRTGSPVILISALEDDATVLEGLKRLGQRSIRPTVVALELGTDPDGEGEEPEPDARDLQARRERTIANLRGTDIPVAPAVAGLPLDAVFRMGLA